MAYENLDQKILNALLDDGRASLRSLGGDLNVSVTTVSNHISNLEEDDVIRGYPPIDDYGELSYDVMAILQLNVKWSALPDITYRLQEHRDMVTVHETTGDHDIIVVGRFSDTDHMNDQIKELLVDPDINESIRVLSSTPSPRTNSSTSSTETPLSASLLDVYSLLTRMYS